MILTKNGNKKAKDITKDDILYTVKIDDDEKKSNSIEKFDVSEGLIEVEIDSINKFKKLASMYFNNEDFKKFSLQQPMFVKKDGEYTVVPSCVVEEGDYLIKVNQNNEVEEILVNNVTIVEEECEVYIFKGKQQKTFIAGDYLVHDK